ncbi:MAG: hypothetical protein ACHP9T_03165 [Caulobacterales bacterium]|jgi:hypothetical protein
MNLKRTALVLILGAASFGAMSTAASAQPLQHPRKHEVLARVQHQRQDIRIAERRGQIGPMKAHRLLAADRRVAREVRSRGYLTRVEQHRLNRQENRIHRHIHS